jgi:putative FmdB family regulatory protein
MPIYEYRCASCGFEKEYLQKLSDAPVTVCENCSQPAMTKLVSAAGFQLKGSGWYATDFKNRGQKPKKGEDQKPEAPKGDAAGAADGKSAAGCGTGACPACAPVQ